MDLLTRRRFLELSTLFGIGCTLSLEPVKTLAEEQIHRLTDLDHLTEFEKLHLPKITAPALTGNGHVVPIIVEMDHPMEPDHYIKSVEILNRKDPVVSKGRFYMTPANGAVYLSTQVRMHSGSSQVEVVAECNQHGEWISQKPITIKEGGGGCATETDSRSEEIFDIRPPTLRIPHLIEEGAITAGEIIKIQVKFKHPSRTGLKLVDGQFVQVKPPFYVKTMEVFYDGNQVSLYKMTEALSDNPFIGFKLKIHKEAPLRIVFTNSQDQQFEVTENFKLI